MGVRPQIFIPTLRVHKYMQLKFHEIEFITWTSQNPAFLRFKG